MVDVAAATPAERAAVLRLLRAQYDEHAIALSDARLCAAVDGVLADPERGTVLLAREGGAVRGLAGLTFLWSLEHGGPAAWLEELYVEPAERGRGLGAALLQAAIAIARARRCAAVDLEVERDHARAANLYLRHGFVAHTRARYVLALPPP